jgi:hypothetical protein
MFISVKRSIYTHQSSVWYWKAVNWLIIAALRVVFTNLYGQLISLQNEHNVFFVFSTRGTPIHKNAHFSVWVIILLHQYLNLILFILVSALERFRIIKFTLLMCVICEQILSPTRVAWFSNLKSAVRVSFLWKRLSIRELLQKHKSARREKLVLLCAESARRGQKSDQVAGRDNNWN